MAKIPKKPFFSQEAYVDHFVIRGVKYALSAHLGEIFEVEHAPYEYIQAVKKIKSVRKIIVHKVDPTNLGPIGQLIRKHQKQLTQFVNYGPWMKKELDSLKKLVRNKKARQIDVNNEYQYYMRQLPLDKNIQEISFNIPAPTLTPGEETGTLGKGVSRLRTLRLSKLKRIIIEGHCDSPNFEPFILNLERDLKYLKSLEEIRFLSVVMRPGSQKMLQYLGLLKLIKEIKIGFHDFSSSVVDFLDNAELLPALEKLTGLMALQELEAASQLEGFKNLKYLDLLFFRENSSYNLFEILKQLKLPKSIESVNLNIVHVDAQIKRPGTLPEQGSAANLDTFCELANLRNVKLVATINPTIDNHHISVILEAVNKISTLKSFHLELNNSMFFVRPEDLVPFDFSLLPLTQGFSNINCLTLKLPLISFENYPENHSTTLQISDLKLEGTFGIKYSENIGRFLQMISPVRLNRLELHELEFNNLEAISAHLGIFGRMKNLQCVDLVYKNANTSLELYHAFREFVKNLLDLSFLSIKIDHQKPSFQDFQKRLLEFVYTLPKMTFARIDPYFTNSSEN